ncbi:MAG: hypothetical protein M3277_05065 [Actinomycetota bacterium]|nr:hypothetical protein [Actinomycetota bacterium]
MKTSTRTLRRLVRGLGLALAVAAVAAPGAQAVSKDDYGIESFRVQGEPTSTYDAIEALRAQRPRERGSLAYDGIELVRRVEPRTATARHYDAIELVRTRPPQVVTRLPYDGIELVRSRPPLAAAPSALVSASGFDWSDAAVSLMISLIVGSAGLLVVRRRADLAAS